MFKKKNNHEAVKTFVRDYFIRVLPRILDENADRSCLEAWDVSYNLTDKVINEAIQVFDQIENDTSGKYAEYKRRGFLV